jgi:phosphoesterase RecJ-like protein
MNTYTESERIGQLVSDAERIVIMQADNPDGDSLGSALALEQILGELGKKVYLYCAVDMPGYIRYLKGWDRVNNELPSQFDLSIIVDASTLTLFEKLASSGQQGWAATRPCIVIDHHGETKQDIHFASVVLNDTASSSTGEVVYKLSRQLNWPVDTTSGAYVMTAILGDTQGLSNDLARVDTYRIMAELLELGVSRPKLEEQRRDYSKMDPSIFKYKASLIERTQLLHDGRIAFVSVPQAEITTYSPMYNPAPLIQNDMLQTLDVQIAIVMKQYDDGRILCAIRSNPTAPIAAELAVRFGGGGHPFASGFKITDGRPFNEVKSECIEFASQLLDNLAKETSDETLQHADQTN